MRTLKLTIVGMRCEGCAETLKALFDAEAGVKAASVSHESGEARILFDPDKVSAGHLVSIAGRPGFDVAEMPGT